MKEKNISFPIIVKSKKIEIGMHSKTGADKGYIQGRKSQLKNYNNQYNDFLKKTGRTKRSGATWISTSIGAGGRSINNLTVGEHKKPVLLKELKKATKENTYKELEYYENIIKNDKIENAIVVTKKGKVYRCFGNANNVYLDVDLGDELIGAYVTHNHPIGNGNINTFTTQDRNIFNNYNLKVLRGTYGDYVFEMNRDAKFIEKMPLFGEVIDADHIENVRKSHEFGFGYKRWKK